MVVAIQMDVTNAYLNSHIKMGHQAYEAMNQSPGQSPMVSYQPTKSFQHFQNYRFFVVFVIVSFLGTIHIIRPSQRRSKGRRIVSIYKRLFQNRR